MAINKIWKNRQKYSLSEGAYLTCGSEPEDERLRMPLIVQHAYLKKRDELFKNNPHIPQHVIIRSTFSLNFVRDWAKEYGNHEFFESEHAKIVKPLKITRDEERLEHVKTWVDSNKYTGGLQDKIIVDKLRKENPKIWGKDMDTFRKWIKTESAGDLLPNSRRK